MNVPRNLVGPQIRQLRAKMDITQPMLVARCQLVGWDISRETIAKIESQIRWVSDFELLGFAKALDVPISDLWPQAEQLPRLLNQFFGRLDGLKGAIQNDLVITEPNHPAITTDNLEVAQFLHLLLTNKKLRDVIDTITSTVVLILGRFTPERKRVLDRLKVLCREHRLLPVLFDFEGPRNRNITETVQTLAYLSRFIIADITSPRSSPQELQATVPNPKVPFVPLLSTGQKPWGMFSDLAEYPWVLPVQKYKNIGQLKMRCSPLSRQFYG
jgi:transcriptional regulator with XRE-family HTH domain